MLATRRFSAANTMQRCWNSDCFAPSMKQNATRRQPRECKIPAPLAQFLKISCSIGKFPDLKNSCSHQLGIEGIRDPPPFHTVFQRASLIDPDFLCRRGFLLVLRAVFLIRDSKFCSPLSACALTSHSFLPRTPVLVPLFCSI